MNELLNILKQTNTNKRLTRKNIRIMTGLSDRNAREAIEVLRNQGFLIVATGDKAGYYLAHSLYDKGYLKMKRELLSRIRNIKKTIYSMEVNCKCKRK